MVSIQIISRENIKPSSPTPQHLRNFKLSYIDQTAPVLYTGILLFYTDTHVKAAQKSQQLKSSLSKLLMGLYPLAGTIIKDQAIIECNDEGAEYIETRVNCSLSDILVKPDNLVLRKFLPVEIESTTADAGRVLFVQSNFFERDEIVIGVCVSHKIADAATLGFIMKSWANVVLESIVFPSFNTSTPLFPPIESSIPLMKFTRDEGVVTKRFVFDASKLVMLKAKATSASVQQPTRVEVVTALIWKCKINVSKSIRGFPRLAMLSQPVNLRKRIVPPLPDNTIGNNVGMFFVAHQTSEEIDLQGLVSKIKKEMTKFIESDLMKTINVEKRTWHKMCQNENFNKRDDVDFVQYTSWCRFPFYEANFGWGKPTWVTLPAVMSRHDAVLMMDTRDGEGIEALVRMSKEDMNGFERDQELLQFAVLNPSVVS